MPKKTYKSLTKNKGTTIILDDAQEAISLTQNWIKNLSKKDKHYMWGDYYSGNYQNKFQECVDSITKGDPEFKHKVEEIMESLLGIVDNIQPQFSQNRQGYTRSSEEGVTTTPELLMSGEEMCILKPKNDAEKEVKMGAGDGAYRLIINTDVSWFGKPEDNAAMVGALITLLQRYAPCEVWVQQGWLGGHLSDGVTLFKLDYTAGLDITNLAFWITHRYKDSVFSYIVNRALGRKSYATSCHAEIESDLMLRGDWFKAVGISYQVIYNWTYTDKMDAMAKYIAQTGYKMIYGEENKGPTIELDE